MAVFMSRASSADEEAFEGDVMKLVRDLGVPVNTVIRRQFRFQASTGRIPSGQRRHVRPGLTWHGSPQKLMSLACTSSFPGVKRPALAPMYSINLGTRGCRRRHEMLSSMRITRADHTGLIFVKRNGANDPFNIKLWCLGNEMDGPWPDCS
jgi:alpha-N-arabinofuranosidase